MQNSFYAKIVSLWGIEKEFRLKVSLLALSYALILCCQAIWRPLKTSIFSKIVGAEFTPDAKLFSLLILIPLIIFYSYLVDVVRRHHVVYYFTLFHGIGGIIFYFILSHPVYGVANTDQNPSRILGWVFYIFMESFTAFLSATFWSFANSINNPKDGKNHYGIIVAGSKLGGMISAGCLYLAITRTSISDHILLPASLLIGSFFLFLGAGAIFLLMKCVPGYYMHGYEAAYQVEKHREKQKKGSFFGAVKRSMEGLFITLKNPYVFGTFSLILFYDISIAIFDYRVLRLADATYKTAGSLTGYYALYYMLMHGIGLLISLLGTTPMQRILGIRFSLFVFPVLSTILLFSAYFLPYAGALFIILVLLRAFNYGLNHPTREILYIPTTKAIKFKAKAWADAFGSRIAKGTGSVFNKVANSMAPSTAVFASSCLTISLNFVWLVVVYFLGKTLQEAIKNKRVIGAKATAEQSEK